MFNTGAEVVIIGSNVKRKSGPRVGSMGHICSSLPSVVNIVSTDIGQNTHAYKVSCNILFHRFGYQKSKRLELQTVHILLPRIEQRKNAELSLNKFTNYINNSARNKYNSSYPMLFAASVNTSYDPYDKNRCVGAVVSAMSNRKILSVLQGFKGETHKYAKVDYKHLEHLVPPNVIDICRVIIKAQNFNYALSLLSEQTNETLKQLLTLTMVVESLIRRNEKSRGYAKYSFLPGGQESLYKSMFIQEDFLKINMNNLGITANTRVSIKKIRTLITDKAFDTLNLN